MRTLQHTSGFVGLLWRINHSLSSPLQRPLQALRSLQEFHSSPKIWYAYPSTGVKGLRMFSVRAAAVAKTDKRRVVFLGTPDVAALVLHRLALAAQQPHSSFKIVAVVSQPGRPKGRGNKKVPQPTPVQVTAEELGMDPSAVLCPEKATDKDFLTALRALQPDLCITAAYGNYLPTAFLSIPTYGTLNIHPSLLPKYRGAAPVQRSLEDGVTTTGVSVLYTVKEMDAGPILAQRYFDVQPDIQAPELLRNLFDLGVDVLFEELDGVWNGTAPERAVPQDNAQATHAPKLTREEGLLNFAQLAVVNHNKVRAFAPWPGTYSMFELWDDNKTEQLEIKVLQTSVGSHGTWKGHEDNEIATDGGVLRIKCGDDTVLDVLEVQVPGRKASAAKDFINGLKGRKLRFIS